LRTRLEDGQSARMLFSCATCHEVVHRGAVPLAVQLEWQSGLAALTPTPNKPEELLEVIRAVPVSSSGTGHERLMELNRYLCAAHEPMSLAARNAVIADVMLAKAAVLNDAYQDVGPVSFVRRAMQDRYRRVLTTAVTGRALPRFHPVLRVADRQESAAGGQAAAGTIAGLQTVSGWYRSSRA
jgi:hypothetical protein